MREPSAAIPEVNASVDVEMSNAGGADQSAQQHTGAPASGQAGPSGTNASAPVGQNVMGWSSEQLDCMNQSVHYVLERSIPTIVSKVAEAVAAQQAGKSAPADGAEAARDSSLLLVCLVLCLSLLMCSCLRSYLIRNHGRVARANAT